MADIIIIGGGTAGLSAAIYVQRAGKSALLLEAKACGGQIINTPSVENYPGIGNISGFDFAAGLREQAVNTGAVIKSQGVLSVTRIPEGFEVKTKRNTYTAKALIIATGAANRHLGLEAEDELVGHGISYCATCDGAFYKDKTVAVVGGGNTALEDAGFLSNYCKKVYLVHRRDAFRGEPKSAELLGAKENVEFVLNSLPDTLLTTEEDGIRKISGLTVKDKLTEEKRNLEIDGVFVAIGQVPQTALFNGLVEMDKSGYIVAGEDTLTSAEGIFAAGDCRTKKVRQLVTAAADGAVAALAACEYAEQN